MKGDAINPVIGVILMVAITVILAAVIAAFVFGMASAIDQEHQSKKLTADENTAKVTFVGDDGSLLRFVSNDTPFISGRFLDFGHCYNVTAWYEVECPGGVRS